MVRSRGNSVLGREREGVENKKEAKKNETNPELYTVHREGDRPCLGRKGSGEKKQEKIAKGKQNKKLRKSNLQKGQ